MRALLTTLALAALLFAACARAASVESLEITRNHGRFHVVAESHLDASPASVYKVLLDYDHYGRISEAYKESGYLQPASDGTPLVYTRIEGCVLFFCRTVRRVERLEIVAPYVIRTTALPDRSDVKYSRSEWRLEPDKGGTKLTYTLDVEPNFWLPPFIRPSFLERILKHRGTKAAAQVEKLARKLDEQDTLSVTAAGSAG